MSKNPMLAQLVQLIGSGNIITIHRAMVDFCEDELPAAMMLEQILYWTPRTTIENGWIAKSDSQWEEEIFQKKHSIKRARAYLLDRELIKTKIDNFGGSPTNHYKITDSFTQEWLSHFGLVENDQWLKSTNPLVENDQSSIAEITPEIIKTIEDVKLPPNKNAKPKPRKKTPGKKKDTIPREIMHKFVVALAEVMVLDSNLEYAKLVRSAKKLWKSGYTPDQIRAGFGFGGPFYNEWPGDKDGQPPKINHITERIKRYSEVEQPEDLEKIQADARAKVKTAKEKRSE